MSSDQPRPLVIPPELEAEMTPAVRAFVEMLLARIAKLEARVEELERGRKTPQNSSLPPSTQHPHAKPAPQKSKSKRKRGETTCVRRQNDGSPIGPTTATARSPARP